MAAINLNDARRPEDELLQGPMTGLQIFVVAICVFISALDGFDVLAVAFTAPAISRQWGLSPIQVGGLFSAGLAGMGAGAFLLSPLSDRIGRRPMILLCLTLLSAGMAMSAMSRSITELMLLRVLTGLGIGGMLSNINTMVAEYASVKRRNLAVSLMTVGYPLGAAFGGLAAVPLVEAFGWRAVYLFGSGVGFALLPIILMFMPESVQFLSVRQPAGALARVNTIMRRMNRPEFAGLSAFAAPKSGSNGALRMLFGRTFFATTALVILMNVSVMMSVYFIASWLPKIVSQSGFSDTIGIYLALILNLSGAFGCLAFGLLANRMGVRLLSTLAFVGLAGALTIFGLVPPQITVLAATVVLVGFFNSSAITAIYVTLPIAFPAAVRGTGIGLGLGAGRVGAVLGPYLAGMLISAGWTPAGYCFVLALPLLLAVPTLYGIRELDRPRAQVSSKDNLFEHA